MDGQWKHPEKLSTVNILSGLLIVFSFAIAAGYTAGASFRPSLAPLAPPVSPILAEPSLESSPLPDPRTLLSGGAAAAASSAALAPAMPVALEVMGPQPNPASPFPAAGDVVVTVRATAASPAEEQAQRFRVETGAYVDPAPAETMATDLRRRGFAVHVIPGPPYRVWVGGSLDRPTADRLVGVLHTAGFDAALAQP